MAAKYKNFEHFWLDQSANLPRATESDQKMLLIARGWAMESWSAATALAEEKFTASNTQSMPCFCEQIYVGCAVDGASCEYNSRGAKCRHGIPLR